MSNFDIHVNPQGSHSQPRFHLLIDNEEGYAWFKKTYYSINIQLDELVIERDIAFGRPTQAGDFLVITQIERGPFIRDGPETYDEVLQEDRRPMKEEIVKAWLEKEVVLGIAHTFQESKRMVMGSVGKTLVTFRSSILCKTPGRLTSPRSAFSVFLPLDGDVNQLRIEIERRLSGEASNLLLWKLNSSIPVAPIKTLSERLQVASLVADFSVALEEPTYKISAYFPVDLIEYHLHIIVKTSSRKRPISPTAEWPEAPKRKRGDERRKWYVNGPIYGPMTTLYYFLDPSEQTQNGLIVRAAIDHQYVLLTGARASGKSTRLFRLRELLEEEGYRCLYITFELVDYSKDTASFWSSIGHELQSANRTTPFSVKVTSPGTLRDAFAKENWDRPVVILIDELSEIFGAAPEIKDSFLRTLRGIRHKASAITSVIAAGTFSLMSLTPTSNSFISPFNILSSVQTPYFSLYETQQLFKAFQQDYNVALESAVVNDIWEKSNGHPGMVCLCGRIVLNNLPSLLVNRTVSFSNWQKFPTKTLFGEILAYNTFRSLVTSLRSERARAAVQLYRTRFAGFHEVVDISESDEDLADFLTAEGVLSRPVIGQTEYRVTSPLIDALMTLKVIPNQFPLAPSIPVPIVLDIPFILTEALKCFDKDLIQSAYSHSFKTSKVPVNDSSHTQVPRESVYDTDMLRILRNWLLKGEWSVTGQWHLKTPDGRNKYSDAVLRKHDKTIVLEFVATADPKDLRAHIENIPGHMGLLSADEGWVIHFTCEDGFTPTWQTLHELSRGVNVIHVSHENDFKNVTLYIYSKDIDKRKQDICLS